MKRLRFLIPLGVFGLLVIVLAIAVAAGGNTQLDYKRGNALIAFTLD